MFRVEGLGFRALRVDAEGLVCISINRKPIGAVVA